MDYAEASSQLTGRCKDRRKVANNTYLERRSDTRIALRLHDTDVLTFDADGTTTYDTGGWRTVTTKDRLNRFGPDNVQVWSARGVWYIAQNNSDDAISVFDEGCAWDGERFQGVGDDPKAQVKERRAIGAYAKRFVAALEAGEVAAPSGGDCWFCALVGVKDGKPWGESHDSKDEGHHLREHLKENYYVPSLLHRALTHEWAGSSQSMKSWVASFWQEDQKEWRRWGERTRVTKALRKYLLTQLGHAA